MPVFTVVFIFHDLYVKCRQVILHKNLLMYFSRPLIEAAINISMIIIPVQSWWNDFIFGSRLEVENKRVSSTN